MSLVFTASIHCDHQGCALDEFVDIWPPTPGESSWHVSIPNGWKPVEMIMFGDVKIGPGLVCPRHAPEYPD